MVKLGQDVCYVTPADAGVNALAHRTAKVVNVNADGTVNLCVFKGHLRENQRTEESATFFVYNVKECTHKSPGTYHVAE